MSVSECRSSVLIKISVSGNAVDQDVISRIISIISYFEIGR